MTQIPVLIGDGIRLFGAGGSDARTESEGGDVKLKLLGNKAWPTFGAVQNTYEVL